MSEPISKNTPVNLGLVLVVAAVVFTCVTYVMRLEREQDKISFRVEASENTLSAKLDALQETLGAKLDALQKTLDTKVEALQRRIDGLESRLEGCMTLDEFDAWQRVAASAYPDLPSR